MLSGIRNRAVLMMGLAGLALAVVLAGCTLAGVAGGQADLAKGPQASHVAPTFESGNPAVDDLLGSPVGLKETKIEGYPVLNKTYGPLTITNLYFKGSEVIGFDFVSKVPILGVFVKGGPGGNFYDYSPDGVTADTELYTPIINDNLEHAGISHVNFAWIPRVIVTKTAVAAFDRDWNWTIAKSNNASVPESPNSEANPVMLDPGQAAWVTYSVTVGATPVDHSFRVSGTITVTNPSYNDEPAVLAGVADVVSAGIAATVSGPAFPFSLAAGATVSYTYTADLPDKESRVNTATVSVEPGSAVQGGSGSADVVFGSVPQNETDESILVTDDLVPSASRTVGLSDLVNGFFTFGYQYDLGTFPGLSTTPVKVTNTASFLTGDNGDAGSASSDVWVQLHPSTGYLRTIGYWKTHAASSYQDNPPYDVTWDFLKDGDAFKPFFLSGQTFIDVMWYQSQGSAYYQLARQYVAALLNGLTGASQAPVAAAMDRARAIFEAYTPAQIAALKANSTLRKQIVALASTLDAYNNGLLP